MAAHQLFLFQLRRWQRKPQAIEPDNPRGVFFEEALEAIRLRARDRTARSSSCWAQKKKGKKMSLSFARCFNEDSTKTITGSVTLSDIWKCCRSWGWGDGGLLDALKWEPYGNAIEHFAIVKLQWGAGFAFSILHSWQLFKLSREQRI